MGPNPMTGVLYIIKGNLDTDTDSAQREDGVKRQREKTAIYKPRSKAGT